MKKMPFLTVIALFIALIIPVFAEVSFAVAPANSSPYFLPYTYNGVTYQHAFSTQWVSGRIILIFYNGGPVYMWGAVFYKTDNAVQYLQIDSYDDILGNGNDVISQNQGQIAYALSNSYCQISDYENSDIDILNDGTYFQRSDYHCNFLYDGTVTQAVIPASTFFSPPAQLDISVYPNASGNISVNNSSCQSYPCQILIPFGEDAEVEAYPDTDYAFVYWEWNNGANSSTSNPELFTMTEDMDVTAVFKKTFRCAAGDFYRDVDDTGGWCTDYVEYETGVDISGNACDWYDNAITAGYSVGSEPEISAIIVLNDDVLTYGHVGIVISYTETTITIRDSNWCDPYCYLVKEHTISRSRSDIAGYIYCTPPN